MILNIQIYHNNINLSLQRFRLFAVKKKSEKDSKYHLIIFNITNKVI